MRRLNGIELVVVALAVVFIVLGLVKLSHPAQGIFFQQSPGDFIITISKGQSRTSGVLLLLLGAGILGAVFYRRRS